MPYLLVQILLLRSLIQVYPIIWIVIPTHPNEKIKITNGSFSPIARKGLITISKSINLKFVFHVLKLACNLMSMSKLTKDCHRRVIFFYSICIFYDRSSKKMIDRARMNDRLHYLNDNFFGNKKKKIGGFSSISSMW